MALSGDTGQDRMRADKGEHRNRIVSCPQCFHSCEANPFRPPALDPHGHGKINSTIYTPSTGEKVTTKSVTGLTFVR